MSIALYGYWRSSASYRVRLALHLKRIEFTSIPVHLVKEGGQQHSVEYRNLNPTELVPTFIDDDEDILLNQSLAIIEYLDERYPLPTLLPQNDLLLKSRIRALAYDIACDTQPLANLRVLQYVNSSFPSKEDEHKAVWAKHWMSKGLANVEQKLQNTAADFCFGFEVSLADICLVPQVYNAERFGISMNDFPLVKKIVDNCNQIDAFKLALPEAQEDAE